MIKVNYSLRKVLKGKRSKLKNFQSLVMDFDWEDPEDIQKIIQQIRGMHPGWTLMGVALVEKDGKPISQEKRWPNHG